MEGGGGWRGKGRRSERIKDKVDSRIYVFGRKTWREDRW
jgi:hypothetical protein